MKPIELEDFLQFNALSALSWSPDGRCAAFLVHRADQEQNGYTSNIYLYQDGVHPRQLTTWNHVKSFIWDDADTILFPSLHEAADQAEHDKGEDLTVFYAQSLSGGTPLRRFSVPLNATAIGKLNEHTYVLQARIHLTKMARLQGLTGEARDAELAAIAREDAHFTILDEYPFWFNGVGVTNKTRVGLWLYDSLTQALTQITPRLYDVEAAKVCPQENMIVYHGRSFETVSDFRTGINVYDHRTGQTRCVVPQGTYGRISLQPNTRFMDGQSGHGRNPPALCRSVVYR